MADSPKSEQDRRLTEYVYERLLTRLNEHTSIMSQQLSVSGLARELEVSRTPVVMALMHLENERLVKRDGTGRWCAVSPGRKDIEEIFELKQLIEPYAARVAAERIAPEDGDKLLAAVSKMEDHAAKGNVQEWLVADGHFHGILFDLVDNERMTRLFVRSSNQMHKLASSKMVLELRMKTACPAHRAIAEAVVAGDSELAAKCAADDLLELRDYVLRFLEDVVVPLLGEEY